METLIPLQPFAVEGPRANQILRRTDRISVSVVQVHSKEPLHGSVFLTSQSQDSAIVRWNRKEVFCLAYVTT